jgi:hypothetical protein
MIVNASQGSQAEQPEQPKSRGRARSTALVMGMVTGLLATVLVAAVVLFLTQRQTTPQLTRAALDAAVSRWEANGPANYNLDLVLQGARPGPIHVEVREGKVTQMTRDGVVPSQRRTWEYWTVPGQLDTIGEELDKAEDPQGSFGTPGRGNVVQRAVFDEQFGYPRKYSRIVLGTPLEVRWEITRFEPNP